MEVDSPEAEGSSTVAPADRIKELLEIDESITAILKHGSDAFAILANDKEALKVEIDNLEDAQTQFNRCTAAFFETLSSVEARLRRQVYAAEEAGLIKPGTKADAATASRLRDEGSINDNRNGTGVALDPSWLAARQGDQVGKTMKEEALNEALEFLNQVH